MEWYIQLPHSSHDGFRQRILDLFRELPMLRGEEAAPLFQGSARSRALRASILNDIRPGRSPSTRCEIGIQTPRQQLHAPIISRRGTPQTGCLYHFARTDPASTNPTSILDHSPDIDNCVEITASTNGDGKFTIKNKRLPNGNCLGVPNLSNLLLDFVNNLRLN